MPNNDPQFSASFLSTKKYLFSPLKLLFQVKYYLALIFLAIVAYGSLPFFLEDPIILLQSKKVFNILLIVISTAALLRIVQYIGDQIKNSQKAFSQKLSVGVQGFIVKLIKGFIVLLAALTVLDSFGVTITPFLASLGIGSLAIALALQDTLSNFFSGVYLIVDQPFQVGDYVRVDDANIEGVISKIGWRSTRISMLQNNTITVPNSKLSSSVLINYYHPSPESSVLVPVGVAYESDLERVEKITIEAAKKVLKDHPSGVSEFEPIVRFHTFGASSIDFNVILRVTHYLDRFAVMHAFIKELKKAYEHNNIEIPFPQRVLTHKNKQ